MLTKECHNVDILKWHTAADYTIIMETTGSCRRQNNLYSDFRDYPFIMTGWIMQHFLLQKTNKQKKNLLAMPTVSPANIKTVDFHPTSYNRLFMVSYCKIDYQGKVSEW